MVVDGGGRDDAYFKTVKVVALVVLKVKAVTMVVIDAVRFYSSCRLRNVVAYVRD